MQIYTIGHGSSSFEKILDLLNKYDIETVVDVRSRPFSRHALWTSKAKIGRLLKKNGIAYHFLGKELGGLPFEKVKDFYDRERNPLFVVGIQNLIDLAKEKRTAVMCSEAKPIKCHRYSIIGKHLTNRGWEVLHILQNGDTLRQQPMLL